MKVGAVNTQLFTTPHASSSLDPEPALLELIADAKSTIELGIYSITLPAVAAALIAAHGRGVTITVAADATEATEPSSQIPAIANAGISVHLWGSEFHLAHFKVIVVDGKAAAFGSYNYSSEAELDDYEILAVFTGVEVTRGGMAAALSQLISSCYAAGTAYPPS